MTAPAERTLQDLLAERRANVMEMVREKDAVAVLMLQAHIDGLDREIARRTGAR